MSATTIYRLRFWCNYRKKEITYKRYKSEASLRNNKLRDTVILTAFHDTDRVWMDKKESTVTVIPP